MQYFSSFLSIKHFTIKRHPLLLRYATILRKQRWTVNKFSINSCSWLSSKSSVFFYVSKRSYSEFIVRTGYIFDDLLRSVRLEQNIKLFSKDCKYLSTLKSLINVQCSVRLFNFLKQSSLYALIKDLYAY